MTTAMTLPTSAILDHSAALPSAAATDAPDGEVSRRWLPRLTVALAIAALLLLGRWVAVAKPYTSGSTLGYNLGLVGGLLMLALLLYPLRKRIIGATFLGRMEHWFKFHMIAGISGPLLVVFHSTFKLSSLNAKAAFYAMLLVMFSGLVGRYIYRHVHRGLYGRHLTLDEARANLKTSLEHLNAVFALQANIEPRLLAFHDDAFARRGGLVQRLWRFVTLRRRSRALGAVIRHDVKLALTRLMHEQKLPRHQLALNYRIARDQILDYLDAVVQTSQLAAWERLFSLWHIIHIPFLYLLTFSGIVHVVAVHMY